MISVFEDPELRKKLLASLKSWEGTPYRHYTLVKGRAVDCALFIGEVLRECGLMKTYYGERLAKDWYLHTKEELLINLFLANTKNWLPNIFEIGEWEPQFGDIIFFTTIKDCPSNHVGIYTENGKMWHVNIAVGVCEIQLRMASKYGSRKIGRIWSGLQ